AAFFNKGLLKKDGLIYIKKKRERTAHIIIIINVGKKQHFFKLKPMEILHELEEKGTNDCSAPYTGLFVGRLESGILNGNLKCGMENKMNALMFMPHAKHI
ncbi:hypothetical protein TNCT_512081, partial [Trichonephila clavata]